MKKGTIFLWIILVLMVLGITGTSIADEYLVQVDAFDPAIEYSGRWLEVDEEEAYMGKMKLSDRASAYAEFTFSGTEIYWYTSLAPNRGKANVYINDELVLEGISLYSAEDQKRHLIFSKDDLEEGTHTIRIDPTGETEEGVFLAHVPIDYLVYRPTVQGWKEMLVETMDMARELVQQVPEQYLGSLAPDALLERVDSELDRSQAIYDDQEATADQVIAANEELVQFVDTVQEESLFMEGIRLWLSADHLELEDGEAVDTWYDSSGNENHAYQDDPDSMPKLVWGAAPGGGPAVRFDRDYLDLPSIEPAEDDASLNDENDDEENEEEAEDGLPQPNTIAAVFSFNIDSGEDQNVLDGVSTAARPRIFLYNANDWIYTYISGDPFWDHTLTSGPVDDPFGVYRSAIVIHDGQESLFRMDGTSSPVRPIVWHIEGEMGTGGIEGLTIGARVSRDRQYLAGDIAELIIFDRRLSYDEIVAVERYLHSKWLQEDE